MSTTVWMVLAMVAGIIKVGGEPFVPRNVIFAKASEGSTVSGEGKLDGHCTWELRITTEVGESVDSRDCVRYYYRTSVLLSKKCVADEKPLPIRSVRITPTPRFCPDAKGKVPAARTETKPISSGITPAGKQQEILEQPDGTKLTILTDAASIAVRVVYTDGTTDVLSYP